MFASLPISILETSLLLSLPGLFPFYVTDLGKGTNVLLQVGLAVMKYHEEQLMEFQDAVTDNIVEYIKSSKVDVETLMEVRPTSSRLHQPHSPPPTSSHPSSLAVCDAWLVIYPPSSPSSGFCSDQVI